MIKSNNEIKLFTHPVSGHSHRAELLLALMGIPYKTEVIDLLSGQQKSAEYLAINPLGKVPAIIDGDTVVYDSNAILVYLALKYDPEKQWFPAKPEDAAAVIRHLSYASGPVEYGVANARLINILHVDMDINFAQHVATETLPWLENELNGKTFLVTDKPTIADVANYSYIAQAPEGDVDLDAYPNIKAWLKNIEMLPGFIGMAKNNVGLRK